jgi:hypothetical protein
MGREVGVDQIKKKSKFNSLVILDSGESHRLKLARISMSQAYNSLYRSTCR